MYEEILLETEERMEKAVEHLVTEFRGIRSGRATPGLVENIRVDYYGTMTPLSQMAQVSVPEARVLVIKPFDLTALKEIEKALQKSDLGISPENDGKVVRLNLPPLSGDQRKKYAAKAKELCEEGRVALRNLRRDANKENDALLKDGEVTEDEHRKLQGQIQDLLKEFEKTVGDIQEAKTTEIMEN